MCKCCENQFEGKNPIIPLVKIDGGIELVIENVFLYAYCPCGKKVVTEINFCPKCGTPLGEVKPLTVEQLRGMDGKPVWCKDRMCALVYIHENWEPHLIFADGSPLINHPANRYTLYDREPKGGAE